MRSSTIHALAHAFACNSPSNAVWPSRPGLSLSGVSVCMSANWFNVSPQSENQIRGRLASYRPPQSSIFQTFSCFLLSFAQLSSCFSHAFCQVPSGQGSARDLLHRAAAVLARLLELRDNGWGRHHYYTHSHTTSARFLCAIISGY